MENREQFIHSFEGQPYKYIAKRKPVQMYVREPSAGCNANTGFMLLTHYWTGTFTMLFDACDEMCDRYNVVTITTEYLQSGQDDTDVPYDLGVVQTTDCLRALYLTIERLKQEGKPFNMRRIYSCGQSGGGIISLLCAKYAPRTFACVFDACGVPGLTEDEAYGVGDDTRARYSRDPNSPFAITKADQEIRDPGHSLHLAQLYALNPQLKFFIVHSQDDQRCSPTDKMRIFFNMHKAGFRPSATFVTPVEVDGEAVTTTEHGLGCAPKIYMKYADEFFLEKGRFAAATTGQNEFELHSKVEYNVTGGTWTIDFTEMPTIAFKTINHESSKHAR